jgi:hypothetical protein
MRFGLHLVSVDLSLMKLAALGAPAVELMLSHEQAWTD